MSQNRGSKHACIPVACEGSAVTVPDGARPRVLRPRAAFKFIGAALGATPTQLGQITLSRALVQAASSPMAGLLGDRLDRVHLIATGCLLWAACTAAIGMSRTLLEARAGPLPRARGCVLLACMRMGALHCAVLVHAGAGNRSFSHSGRAHPGIMQMQTYHCYACCVLVRAP